MRSKYGAKPTIVDGIRFASKAEARRYGDLKLLEKAGEIRQLKLQPRYPIEVNLKLICTYVGDFSYREKGSPYEIVEDVKGYPTPEFKLKAKLFAACHADKQLRVIQSGRRAVVRAA